MNKEEYNSLRAEILGLINIQNNYIVAMYTITIAILSLAIQQQNEWLFLLPYVILFSFQRIISAKNDGMIRIAAYIAVFLDGEIGWEKNYSEIVNRTTNKRSDKFSKLLNVISGRISSLQLGVVCSVGCSILSVLKIKESEYGSWANIANLRYTYVLPIFCAILLLGSLKEWCKGALKNVSIRDQYIDALKVYRNELESAGVHSGNS